MVIRKWGIPTGSETFLIVSCIIGRFSEMSITLLMQKNPPNSICTCFRRILKRFLGHRRLSEGVFVLRIVAFWTLVTEQNCRIKVQFKVESKNYL